MLLLIGGGALVILLAVTRLGGTLIAPFHSADEHVADTLYDYSRRGRGPHIVAIGGGTGMPALLRGLREYTRNITAIVTVADDGGSSGRLRRELGLLPPGDFRNNIAALSRDEALMTQVLQYRFGSAVAEAGAGGSELQGHAFGNLLLAALTGIMGSFD
ncbi:MAG: YvcK family protein, partial [Anaerolineales bacterium]|nr:YvcK family protein [Anaerolineales bacterium]